MELFFLFEEMQTTSNLNLCYTNQEQLGISNIDYVGTLTLGRPLKAGGGYDQCRLLSL